MDSENILEDQVKTLNENLASKDYEAAVQTAMLMIRTHHKSAEDINLSPCCKFTRSACGSNRRHTSYRAIN